MNKVISVPINYEAKKALDYDRARPDQLLEINLDEAEFNLIYSNGIFDLINETVSVNIDNYESE